MSSQQSLLLLLLIAALLATLVVIASFVMLIVPSRRRPMRRTDRVQHGTLYDLEPFADSPWPELHFEMDVSSARLGGIIFIILGVLSAFVFVSLSIVNRSSGDSSYAILIISVVPSLLLVWGAAFLLSCRPDWQSHVTLEAEQLVVQPTFGRQLRIVNYNQICHVGYQPRGGVLVRYYPSALDGQIDLLHMRELRLPSTAHNEGLLLALRARVSGPPINRNLELRLMSKQFVPLLALWGATLIAGVLLPNARPRFDPMFFGLIVPGFFLVTAMIALPWLLRRK